MYNRVQLDKNLILFESSLNEVFAKYSIEPSEILYQRAETTIALSEIVREGIERFAGDSYIDNIITKIDFYRARFEELRTIRLKSFTELQVT